MMNAPRDCIGVRNPMRIACLRAYPKSCWRRRPGEWSKRRTEFSSFEAFNLWWQVFMDGREFVSTNDVTPTWHGYSTGKWDGDTLVIDSRGFNGKVWLDQLGKPS